MSLYNSLFGVNPWAGLLLQAIGMDADSIPRFRDCYLDDDGDIVIYTRTGGGNREYYDGPNEENSEGPWNSTLRDNEFFIEDVDDDFDSTYALFKFSVPDPFKAMFESLKTMGAEGDPKAKWEQVMKDLNSNADTPASRRAMEVGQGIMKQIEDQIRKDGGEA